jgi:hypothetical protein
VRRIPPPYFSSFNLSDTDGWVSQRVDRRQGAARPSLLLLFTSVQRGLTEEGGERAARGSLARAFLLIARARR